MVAILIALRKWLPILGGKHVILYCDNYAVVGGLKKRSFNGAVMAPLRDICMLLARNDISISVQWIPTKSNSLADMLSRGLYDKIVDLYPQLRYLQVARNLPTHLSSYQASAGTPPSFCTMA